MKENTPLMRRIGLATMVLSLTGCISFPVIRDARTLAPGQNCFYGSVAGGVYDTVVTRPSPDTASGKSVRESGLRTAAEPSCGYVLGLTDGLDVTALFRRFGEFGAEMKYRFWADPELTRALAVTMEAYTLPPTSYSYSGFGLTAGFLATSQFGHRLSFTGGARGGRAFFDDSRTSYNTDLYGYNLWFGEATLTARTDLTETLSLFLTGGVRFISPSTFTDQINTVTYGSPFLGGLGVLWTIPENLTLFRGGDE